MVTMLLSGFFVVNLFFFVNEKNLYIVGAYRDDMGRVEQYSAWRSSPLVSFKRFLPEPAAITGMCLEVAEVVMETWFRCGVLP